MALAPNGVAGPFWEGVPAWVLECLRSDPYTDSVGSAVDHGYFWPANTVLGPCTWDAWVATDLAGYYLGDGPQGSHALLFGHEDDSGGFRQFGNFNTNTPGTLSYTSDENDLIGRNEWGHDTVGLAPNNGRILTVHRNGVMTCYLPQLAGERTSYASGNASLGIGGRSHQSWAGRLGMVHGFDVGVYTPLANPQWLAFRPPFQLDLVRQDTNTNIVYADFAAEYTKPGHSIPDLSFNQAVPLTGTRFRGQPFHHGRRVFGFPYQANDNESANVLFGGLDTLYPRWVMDPSCPLWQVAPRTTINALVSPPTDPLSDGRTTLLYTSFAGERSTFVETASPSLAPISIGSLGGGPQEASVVPYDAVNNRFLGWGTMFGRAISMATYETTAILDKAALWDYGAGNPDAAVEILVPTTASAGRTNVSPGGPFLGPCVVFRCSDPTAQQNMWVAAILGSNNFYLIKVNAGVLSYPIGPTAIPAGWNGIRVIPTGNSLQCYYTSDRGTSWTAIGAPVVDAFNNASHFGGITTGGSFARFDSWRASV